MPLWLSFRHRCDWSSLLLCLQCCNVCAQPGCFCCCKASPDRLQCLLRCGELNHLLRPRQLPGCGQGCGRLLQLLLLCFVQQNSGLRFPADICKFFQLPPLPWCQGLGTETLEFTLKIRSRAAIADQAGCALQIRYRTPGCIERPLHVC